MKKYFLLFAALVTFNAPVYSQYCCGLEACFGLMGQFGLSAGYGIQGYSAQGFNDYIQHYNQKRTQTLSKQMGEFGSANSFWFGGKLFQFYIPETKMLFNTRVFAQFTTEKEYAQAGEAKREYTLTTSTLGFGFGINYVIDNSLDFKLIELFGTYSNAGLKNELKDAVNGNTSQGLESPEGSFGAAVYTGVVVYPLPPNIAIELNLGYNYIDIPEMKFKTGGAYLAANEDTNRRMDNFIDGGGFSIHAVLTVAFDVDIW